MHQILGLSKGFPRMDHVITIVKTMLYDAEDEKVQVQYMFSYSTAAGLLQQTILIICK